VKVFDHHNGEIRNPREMLERCSISSLLDEIECYLHRVRRNKYCNPTFIVEKFSGLRPMGFTSQVREGFPTLKIICLIILFVIFSIICLLPPKVFILYLYQRGKINSEFSQQPILGDNLKVYKTN